MGETIRLTAADGHELTCYRAMPPRPPRAGLVLIQEIFGVNGHIRSVADRLAIVGYAVHAPALFDRVEPGVELGYGEDDVARGRELRAKLGWDDPLKDIAAAVDAARAYGRVGAVGFCWGGSLAFLSATRLDVDAAVAYYGGQIIDFVDEHPKAPVMFHFGAKDPLIPADAVETIRVKHPEAEHYVYQAGHGFNCDQRGDYEPQASRLALERTLTFLHRTLLRHHPRG